MSAPITLSTTSADLVRATLPAVDEAIDDITTRFYRTLLAAHPELEGAMFDPGRLADGTQQRALAAAIVSCASMLVTDDGTPEQALAPVARRHATLGVQPDQYDVVHDHLFAAIGEVLGDAVTPEVAAAWDEVYTVMARTLIALEAGR